MPTNADPQLNLSYARTDAEAFAETLKTDFGFDPIWTHSEPIESAVQPAHSIGAHEL